MIVIPRFLDGVVQKITEEYSIKSTANGGLCVKVNIETPHYVLAWYCHPLYRVAQMWLNLIKIF